MYKIHRPLLHVRFLSSLVPVNSCVMTRTYVGVVNNVACFVLAECVGTDGRACLFSIDGLPGSAVWTSPAVTVLSTHRLLLSACLVCHARTACHAVYVGARVAVRAALTCAWQAMYDQFFDTREEHQHQVYYYINDKFKAAFAQWLSSCDDYDRTFCQKVPCVRAFLSYYYVGIEPNRSKAASSNNRHSLTHARLPRPVRAVHP
jgi:hypothetical protein